jgi:hypothetical protein
MPSLTCLHFGNAVHNIYSQILINTPPIKYLRKVIGLAVKNRFRQFPDIKDLLRPFRYVTELDIYVPVDTNYKKRLGQYLPNIEKLSLSGVYLDHENIHSLTVYCPRLRELNVLVQNTYVLNYLPKTLESLSVRYVNSKMKGIPLIDITTICPNISVLGIGNGFEPNMDRLIESPSLYHITYLYSQSPTPIFKKKWNDSCLKRKLELDIILMDVLQMMPKVLVTLIKDYVPERKILSSISYFLTNQNLIFTNQNHSKIWILSKSKSDFYKSKSLKNQNLDS